MTDLSSQIPAGVLAVGRDPIRLTWRVEAALSEGPQRAYELQAASDNGFLDVLASGEVVGDDQVGVEDPAPPLTSREQRWYRVRVQTASGWSDWGPPLCVEAGLLDAGDWTATAIGVLEDPGVSQQAPALLFRRDFAVPGPVVRARLYLTAYGILEASINGSRVSQDLFAPGWTAYRHRLLVETYDVSQLLRHGPNAIGVRLADGWYRGRLGWDPTEDRARYGTELALLAQLEITLDSGETMTVSTDDAWRSSTAEIRSADFYDGSSIDLRLRQLGWDEAGFDDSAWPVAVARPLDLGILEHRVAPPVRVIEARPADASPSIPGIYRVDVGQNISGYLCVTARGHRGQPVAIRHAEVLDPDGSLHTRSLRSARATDTYVLADDSAVRLEPAFTFHGFRYADIQTDAEVVAVEAMVISSDTPRRGTFACSDEDLTRFHENVVWSQRDNFVSLPTDCPQRDERLGWTGDAQAFAATASTLFESEAFWSSWLRDLALDQDDVLGVPSVVPDVVLQGEPRFGRAGWADAATIVPWAVYESYGDPEVVRSQYDSMRRWVDSLVLRRGSVDLLPEAMQFGDWLDPTAPPDRPWEAKADPTFLANAFFAHSARLTAEAADLLGLADDAARYRELARQVREATWTTWKTEIPSTETGCAIAIGLDIAPESDRASVGDALAAQVRAAGGRVATGFLGTPFVLPALTSTGHLSEAYLALLCRDIPSWLYQVTRGATTVWERWDAIQADGSIHPGRMASPPGMNEEGEGHMLSFNHYAYGAVIDWVYRNVAGIAPVIDRPGYRHVVFAPRPHEAITWSRAEVISAMGPVRIDWRLDGSALVASVDLPFGATASFIPPATPESTVTVDGASAATPASLGPGRHDLLVTEAAVLR